MIVANLNNNRCPKKAWMVEAVWKWFIIHTDAYADTGPKHFTFEPQFKGMITNFGATRFMNTVAPN